MCVCPTEFQYPTPNRLVSNIDASLSKEIFNIAVANREAEVEPYGLTDNVGMKTMALIRNVVHLAKLACGADNHPVNVIGHPRVDNDALVGGIL